MDTFDHIEQPQDESFDTPSEPITPPETPETPAASEVPAASLTEPAPSPAQDSTDTGREKSPYADSPYLLQHQPEYHYQPQTQKPPKPENAHRAPGVGRRLLAAVLVIALVVTGCLITAASVNAYQKKQTEETISGLIERISALENQQKAASSREPGLSHPVSGGGLTPSQIYADNVDSVVGVSCNIGVPGFFGISEGTSMGSGFILREDGYIVTNAHMVEDATDATVTLNDGTEYSAQIVGADTSNDIAMLKIEAEGLPAVTLGSSTDLQIGDMVVAIGNPLSLSASQTVGYVSGIDREVTTESATITMIQTDAAINSGSSGGALFNMQGQVVGITTAKYSGNDSGASIEGISFAIPIDDVKDKLSDLMEFGYVTGAYLGVTVQDMDPYAAEMYGLPNGAYVVTVSEGGSADRAGVQPKDIITKLGDYEIGSMTELTRSLRNFKAGDETTIVVVRGGKELSLSITLDEKPRDLNNPAYWEEPEMPDSGDYDEWYDYFRWYFSE